MISDIETELLEIFSSLQGEGIFVGYKQLFIRFTKCNLNCDYCDTPHRNIKECVVYYEKKIEKLKNPVTLKQLLSIINKFEKNFHSISLTGNEPLMNTDFLLHLLPKLKKNKHKIFLETNGTLPDELDKIIDYVDIISMDYKLESSTKQKIDTDKVIRFIDIAKQKNFYIKLVVNKNIDYSDIYNFMQIDLPKDTQIIIQPVTLYKTNKMDINFAKLSEIQNIILNEFNNVRIIPQSHKYFNIK